MIQLRRKSKRAWGTFGAGCLSVVGLMMAYQDFLGQEAYVRECLREWVALSPVWGVLVFALGLALFLFGAESEEVEDEEST